MCTRQGAPVALVGTRASVALDECSWAIIYEPEPGGEHDRPADEAKRHDRLRGGVHDAHGVGAAARRRGRTPSAGCAFGWLLFTRERYIGAEKPLGGFYLVSN